MNGRRLFRPGFPLALIAALALAACSGSTDATTTVCATTGATKLTKVFGDNREVAAGGPVSLVVLASNAAGEPVCGLRVNWTTGVGTGSVSPAADTTSSVTNTAVRGTATTTWTVGPEQGAQTVIATIVNVTPQISVTFAANVVPEGTCIPVRTITISDDFGVGDHWNTSIRATDGTVSHSEAQQSTGGNPGGYRQMSQVVGPPAGASGTSTQTVDHLYTFFSYNPSLAGALCSVVYREDQISVSGGAVAWGPIITQSGVVYSYHPAPAFNATVWTSKGPYTLTAEDFSPAGLDFSDNGPPISFGYFRTVTSAVSPSLALTTVHGIDNWRFEINGR